MKQANEDNPGVSLNHDELRRVLHDLSNTMTGLLMNTGLLSLALRGNDRLRRYTNDIAEAGELGAALVREARDLVNQGVNIAEEDVSVTDQCDKKPEHLRTLEGIEAPPVSGKLQ